MKAHAELFDVEIPAAKTVTQIQTYGDYKSISTESGNESCDAAILLAPGHLIPEAWRAWRRRPDRRRDPFLRHLRRTVLQRPGSRRGGRGNSGVEEGLFLTKFASKVTVLELQD